MRYFGKLQLTLSDKNMDNSLQRNDQYYNSVSNHPNSYSIADRLPQRIGFPATNELHFFNANVADPNSESSLIPASQEGENLVCSCLSSPRQLYADVALRLGCVTKIYDRRREFRHAPKEWVHPKFWNHLSSRQQYRPEHAVWPKPYGLFNFPLFL